MKVLLPFFCCLSLALSGTLPDGVDSIEDLDIDDFEDYFGLDHVTDPEEKEKREEALKENEEMIKEANEAYNNGDQSWYDEVNEYSDLPMDEFLANHTGLLMNVTERFATGLLPIKMPYDEVSERYFDGYRYSRSTAPAAYNAVTAGLVTSVKSQGTCGSCAAFATMALVETCFAKQLGGASNVGDYSEQHILDCGYDGIFNNGCNGAAPHGYAKYLKEKKPSLSSETAYPYKGQRQSCPTTYTTFFQGASITGAYWTESGTEDTLKSLVAEHGAVMTGVYVDSSFQGYKGGIFAGCSSGEPNHAVVVVGYGTEGGTDYWLIKNSWGSSWGEKGYIRLKRGAKMCGVGGTIVHMKCAKASGTTSATQATTATTAAPTTAASTDASCTDLYTNCPQIAENLCYMVKTDCCKSCGLGKGMTPAKSNTCYDEYQNCSELCDYVPNSCKKSCNKC